MGSISTNSDAAPNGASGDGLPDLRSPLLPAASGGNGGKEEEKEEEEEERSCRRMGIDEMLSRHAGEFGRWQLRHFLLVSAAWALEAMHTMVIIFADREPDRSCPPGPAVSCDPCRPGSSGSWEWAGGPWSSTVAEWGLVCGEKYKVGLVQSAFFAGCMIGAGVFGHLSDSFLGRKGSLIIVCALNTVFGLLTALSPTYWVYAGLRLLTGFSTGGVGLCAFVLATEPVGPSKRGVAGMSTFYFFSGGIALLACLAYLFPSSWRWLYVATSLPSLLFLVAVLPSVSESPRWYLVRRRLPEALAVMRAIARANGRTIPAGVTLKLDDEDEESPVAAKCGGGGGDDEERQLAAASGSIVDVLRSPVTRIRLVLTVGINFLCSVVYYGLSLNVVNLKTDLYLSVFVNAVAELPAYAATAALLGHVGRRPLGVGTMWLSGAFCVAGSAVGGAAARMACGVLGIFGMAATYNLLFIYTAELFPTAVRNVALGSATQAAQMGAILAPLVVVAGGGVAFAVFGACGIVGGMLAFYLPETMNKPLYDTMAGMAEAESKG